LRNGGKVAGTRRRVNRAGRPNPAAQAGQTFEKNVSGLTCGTAANTTWPFSLYSATLSSPFTAEAGTKYWLSIQATTPSYAVYFGWRDGTVYNNLSLQLFAVNRGGRPLQGRPPA
jgi:hypothetical protein